MNPLKLTYIRNAAAALALGLVGGLSSSAATYSINVADFSALSVDNGVPVVYRCMPDSAGWTVFECEPDMASKIILTNNKNQLRVQLDIEEVIVDPIPTLYVYSSMLTKVTNNGDSIVSVHLSQPVSNFQAKVIGNGTLNIFDLDTHELDSKITTGRGVINIAGKAPKAKLTVTGTGTIDARNLETLEVSSKSFGPGHIICSPTKKLSATGMSGRVYYIKEPEQIGTRGIGVKVLPVDSLPENLK